MHNKKANMIRWGFIIFSLILLASGTVQSQQKYRLTVSQAADLALKNVTEIKNLQIDRELQLAKNNEVSAYQSFLNAKYEATLRYLIIETLYLNNLGALNQF